MHGRTRARPRARVPATTANSEEAALPAPGRCNAGRVIERIQVARRALVLGIGGGGDVVGALAVARLCESLGTPCALGGVAWERFAIDPRPGPRPLDEIRGGERLDGGAVLADAETSTDDGIAFAEAGVAGFLEAPTALIDITRGAAGAAGGIAAAMERLECDLLVGVDVGGDMLGRGDEEGLASPLCDAVMVAAMVESAGGSDPLLAMIGAGCDGELAPAQVLERVAALARVGAWVGTWGTPLEVAAELERAAGRVPTEASLMVARCARGETSVVPIRGGRRHVELGPVGALAFFFDPVAALAELPLAQAARGSESIDEARDALAGRGVRTELDYERDRAAERQGT
jgi:hypothetical protein